MCGEEGVCVWACVVREVVCANICCHYVLHSYHGKRHWKWIPVGCRGDHTR